MNVGEEIIHNRGDILTGIVKDKVVTSRMVFEEGSNVVYTSLVHHPDRGGGIAVGGHLGGRVGSASSFDHSEKEGRREEERLGWRRGKIEWSMGGNQINHKLEIRETEKDKVVGSNQH